jgi:hypothetical protein
MSPLGPNRLSPAASSPDVQTSSKGSFDLGGSLSANCHGWTTGCPPIASTVKSFRLMTAEGRIVPCSRDENADLFSAVWGGYGLIGVILDANLTVVPNVCLKPECFVIQSNDYTVQFNKRACSDSNIMAYGRLSIVPGETFLKEAILTVFHRVPNQNPPALSPTGYRDLRRALVRGSVAMTTESNCAGNRRKAHSNVFQQCNSRATSC